MGINSLRKEFRRFKDFNYYDNLVSNKFYLLPFNFRRLNSKRELIISMLGDFLIVPEGTVEKLVLKDIKGIDENLYYDLLSNHIVHDSKDIKSLELLSNRYRAKKSNSFKFAQLHIFVITLRCDHTCQYCQVSRVSENKGKFDFSKNNLYKGIDLMLSSPEDDLTMEFQGGEALLAFDRIKEAIAYTKSKAELLGKRINYVICTNLAPISREILEYCKEEKILISCSLDGHENLHNENRKRPGRNSYDLVSQGLNLSFEILGRENVSALMTTTSLSLEHPIKIIDEYRQFGFKSVFLRPISPYGFATKNKNSTYQTAEFIKFFSDGLDYIIDLNKNGEYFKETYTSILLKKILTAYTENYVDLMSPSGLVNSVMLYDYDGKVFLSDEARMLAQMNDYTFQIGTVNDSWENLLSSPVIEKISNAGVNDYLAGCSTCAYNIYCGADPVHHHATQKDMYGFRPDSSFCMRNMSVLDIIFNKIDTDNEVLEIFKSWVNNE
ncbi:His-Xaa-Ser system radical SAM maturase HxsB [Flavobacterium sp. 14A]|uniref:His-Xaa-Ser system radical SAM maturase HxsB n=1 Tax=Flavobacterium sp. 14A TaxID=2735896 RepID=UPI0015708984|nr:His-Xaa-Ser system radical SAM maturase HxsB [Flavobacterium sp. 14A]NRT13134.1 His-Xaa-Ser system radical SAM maturase HxsB [Flavobacterium sp. 14A]